MSSQLDRELMQWVAHKTNVSTHTIEKVISLLHEGNTVPFIARYRKEVTGGLNEVQIKSIQDTWQYAVNLATRKQEVIRLIEEQGKMTEELRREINQATQLQKVEDLYRPYKQKRRTRATIAKEKGLEPLAELIWNEQSVDLAQEAIKYLSEEHDLHTVEDVLAGVNDIVAEWISDHAKYREWIREETFKRGIVRSELKDDTKDKKQVYQMYYEYQEPVRSMVSHRILALNRGEKEEVLRVVIEPPIERILEFLQTSVIKPQADMSNQEFLRLAIEDRYSCVFGEP